MYGMELYQLYQSLSLHFNTNVDYDCVKYNFKTRVNPETFKKSKFKWQFAGAQKKISTDNLKFAVFNVFDIHGFTYTNQLKFIQTISRHASDQPETFMNNKFKKDIQYLKSVYNGSTKLFQTDNTYPNVYQEYLDGEIDIKSVMLLNIFIKDVINNDNSRDIIAWPRYVKEANNLRNLVGYFYNKKQVESIFVSDYLS
jgi:hypothetical protein